MLKFMETAVGFAEVPDEISLCIGISGCCIRCRGCHSRWLWKDEGAPLDERTLLDLIGRNEGITCVCMMGGEPQEVCALSGIVRWTCALKYAWYTGLEALPEGFPVRLFDYIKTGPYREELGGLASPSTNQRFYRIEGGKMVDMTERFWK